VRVLITGATTPVGQALVRELLADPATERVIAVGREPVRPHAEIDGRVRHEQCDLSRERSLRRLLFGVARDEAIDTIVDMAAHRDPSARGPRARNLTARSTRLLLRLGERLPRLERYVLRSYGEIYERSESLPAILDEEHPLRIGSGTPQWILDRVEADLAACARMGMSRMRVMVLRATECLAPRTGSQLWDWLQAPVCFRPFGFDPIVNVISEEDLARALALAAKGRAQGIVNVPGLDTLPLREVVARFARADVAVPGPMLLPLYAARRATVRMSFDYALTKDRLHFGGVLDGERAEHVLGFVPQVPVRWPLRLDRVAERARSENPRALRGKLRAVAEEKRASRET